MGCMLGLDSFCPFRHLILFGGCRRSCRRLCSLALLCYLLRGVLCCKTRLKISAAVLTSLETLLCITGRFSGCTFAGRRQCRPGFGTKPSTGFLSPSSTCACSRPLRCTGAPCPRTLCFTASPRLSLSRWLCGTCVFTSRHPDDCKRHCGHRHRDCELYARLVRNPRALGYHREQHRHCDVHNFDHGPQRQCCGRLPL